MSETNEKQRIIFRVVTIALIIIFLVSTALLLIGIWEKKQGFFPTHEIEETYMEYDGEKYVLKDGVENYLVLGLDKFSGTAVKDSYNNDQQADFLMLLVVDNNSKKYTALHINRDTMLNINVLGVAGQTIDTVTGQVALAHTYGNGKEVSCRNTADAVSELLHGVKVSNYISFTMDSVPILNDLVGGVEVEVLEDFGGIDNTLVKGETVTLMGEHALNYVRTRYGLEDSSNNTRMKRQKQYLEAFYTKAVDIMKNDEEFIVNASLKMSDYIVSNRSVTQLQELSEKFAEYEYDGVLSMEGETVIGEEFIEFYPDPDSIKKIVIDLFYKPKD